MPLALNSCTTAAALGRERGSGGNVISVPSPVLPVMSQNSLVTKEFWDITGNTGEGTLMTFPPDPRSRPSAAAVVQEFKAKGIDPEGYVLYTYAAIQIWAEAATKAHSAEPRKV